MTDYLALGIQEDFTEGWALIPFKGEKVHFWKAVKIDVPRIYKGGRVSFYRSKCGLVAKTGKGVHPLNPGNFPKCKRCKR